MPVSQRQAHSPRPGWRTQTRSHAWGRLPCREDLQVGRGPLAPLSDRPVFPREAAGGGERVSWLRAMSPWGRPGERDRPVRPNSLQFLVVWNF